MSFSNTNTLAIVSLVASILGGFAIVGIITGHIALNQIKRTGEKGRGLALAGLIVGYVALVVSFILVAIWVAIIAAAAANGTLTTTTLN
jgi:peptidyl-prolyl cis-trans isomerase B (cyclophilin B)